MTLQELAQSLGSATEISLVVAVMGMTPDSGLRRTAGGEWVPQLTLSVTDGTGPALVHVSEELLESAFRISRADLITLAKDTLDAKNTSRGRIAAAINGKRVRIDGQARLGLRGLEIAAKRISFVEDQAYA